MIIIGITGTLGAGKGTVVDYLVEHKSFKHFSVRGFITEEIQRRSLPVDRDHMVVVANDLRAKHSSSYIVDQLYEKAIKTGTLSIIESIRTYGEIKSLRSKGLFKLIAIDADQRIRFQRIRMRDSETDQVSFERFKQDEEREMSATDPNKQNLRKCIEVADFVVRNDGTIEELYQQVDLILDKIN